VTASARALRIGTRGSKLAVWQAEHVARRLGGLPDAPPVEQVRIKTEGDRILDAPLSTVAGKGFFTKEIEVALLERRVDLAVHSLKDLETSMPDGLCLGAVLEREDPRDVLISRGAREFEALPAGSRIGTSSRRRRAMLLHWRGDVRIADLRGNVPTRIRKLEEGAYDAIVLAGAGVKRLGMDACISSWLPAERVPPAVGQAAVAVQTRADDETTLPWVRRLDHRPTRQATAAERALLHELEGGCQVPIGALAVVDSGRLTMNATLCDLDGRRLLHGVRAGAARDAEAIGRALARELRDRGGDVILESIRSRDRRGEKR
jgi:hydroxymethylbilane synthase